MPEAADELFGPVYCPKGNLVYVDLARHANRRLAETMSRDQDNHFKELPQGEQCFAGVKFRIGDSVIRLGSTRLSEAPAKIEGIAVHGRVVKLYLLHGSQWGDPRFGVKDGTVIGKYLVRYADGCNATIPIVSGEERPRLVEPQSRTRHAGAGGLGGAEWGSPRAGASPSRLPRRLGESPSREDRRRHSIISRP